MSSGFCRACNASVELVVRTVTPRIVLPALAGLGLGVVKGSKNPLRDSLVAGVAGLAIGLVANALTAQAQRLICGRCGCSDVHVT